MHFTFLALYLLRISLRSTFTFRAHHLSCISPFLHATFLGLNLFLALNLCRVSTLSKYTLLRNLPFLHITFLAFHYYSIALQLQLFLNLFFFLYFTFFCISPFLHFTFLRCFKRTAVQFHSFRMKKLSGSDLWTIYLQNTFAKQVFLSKFLRKLFLNKFLLRNISLIICAGRFSGGRLPAGRSSAGYFI